jgi:hypothetical protein
MLPKITLALALAITAITMSVPARALPGDYPRRAGMKDWIDLHRPDGEVVHIKADQIVFVMSATGTGADKRVHSKLQLVNGFSDVRESVEEVMQAIQNSDSDQISNM